MTTSGLIFPVVMRTIRVFSEPAGISADEPEPSILPCLWLLVSLSGLRPDSPSLLASLVPLSLRFLSRCRCAPAR